MKTAAVLFALLALAAARAQPAAEIKGFAPVSVSSANYRETPWDKLSAQVHRPNTLNPAPREVAPLAAPRYFVFIPGEIFPADLKYEAVCELLATALAQKNYLNAADSAGRIAEPQKVTLMLRVNYGVSLWRNPVVRTEHITWDEGLVGKVHDARSLTHLGGDVAWDSRAGGNDDALDAGAKNAANTSSFFGSGGGGATGTAVINTTSAAGSTYDSTRDFNLIVVDAFDYAELKSKGKSAKALWTTFVAAPVQHGQKFSQALTAMLRAAAPYWGETTSGLQIFNDARAEVRIGEAVEVKDPQKK
ncbi:MAG: hypothetical protein NTV51_25395 [Verrucomicrobia bacterium]|nr:hypothetical protein [Verrucomicrobiota bacterium]